MCGRWNWRTKPSSSAGSTSTCTGLCRRWIRPVAFSLIPIPHDIKPLDPSTTSQSDATSGNWDYLYEPEPQRIFQDLLPRHVQVQVYRALLESNAAFFAAQMTAMDSATRNSAEMIENLTLYMNKVRQAAITREIIEVVSGAAAT